MNFWFGLLLLLFGLFFIGLVIYLWPRKEAASKQTPEAKPHSYQDRAQPGQGVLKNVATRFTASSDAKTQAVVNEATAIATEGIRLTTDATSADLDNRALPERHEQILEKETADKNAYLSAKEAEQQEAKLRVELAGAASQKLLTTDDLSAVNKHFYLKEIDLKAREVEIRQDLDAADRYELTQHELINKLTGHHGQLIKERRRIELEESDEYVRQRLLERHDKNISVVEKLIDGRQTRLLLSENGQENGGDSPRNSQGGADSQETPEAD